MLRILRLPLIPVLIAYISGLSLGHFDLPLPFPGFILFLLILLLSGISFLILKRLKWSSCILLFLFFLLGVGSIHPYLRPSHSSSPVSRFIGHGPILIEGTVQQSPHRTPDGTQLTIKSHQVILSNRHIPVEGNLLLFLKEEGDAFHLGDHLRFQCKLSRPRGFHNPGGFSYERYLAFKRIESIGFLPEGKGWVKIGEGLANPLLLWIETRRDHMRSFLDREAEPPSSSIFQALVLGEQGNIPEEVKELFIITGIAHLLAISGDHLGIVALLSFSLFLWLLKRSEFLLLSLPAKKWAAALTIPCILLYTLIAGGGMSVIRAAIMVITFFFSILFDRERNLLHTLALAAFLILLFSPPSLFDVSFQLSFLAVLSILYWVPRVLRDLRRDETPPASETSWKGLPLRYMKISLVVTAVAILGTAPFVALHFNRFSFIGFLTNLFAIPWVGFLIVPISLIASLCSFFLYPLASLLIVLDGYLVTILLKGVGLFASLPYASVYLPTPTGLEIVLFYLLLFSAVHLRRRRVRYLFAGVCLVFALDLAYWELKDSFRKDLRVTFIDVGHGDSILIEFPEGKRMLIDGGGLYEDRFDTGKNVIAPFLWKKRIRRIDTLVLTHPDPDHLKGLNFIASQFSIGQFWGNGLRGDSESFLRLEKTLQRRKIQCLTINEDFSAQRINGVEITILNPPAFPPYQASHRDSSMVNNQSLVMRMSFKEIVLLLTGDIEREAEERMVRKGYPLKAHLLKIPHHGSSSSSSPAFLERVRPLYAILSVGERNRARLPHPEVIRRYLQSGSILLRTDRHGGITVTTDGEGMEVKTFSKRESPEQERLTIDFPL